MRKTTVIAQCLVNSGMVAQLPEAEVAIEEIFRYAFPREDFGRWNQDIDDSVGERIISGVGSASRPNVRRLIDDLR